VIPPVTFWIIDRGVFLPDSIASHHPLPGGVAMEGADDPRRLRALVTYVLHTASAREGHSLLPLSLLTQRATALRLNPPCEVTPDLIELFEDEWEDDLIFPPLSDGKRACQLAERNEIALDIRNLIQRARHTRGRLAITANWTALLARELGVQTGTRDA